MDAPELTLERPASAPHRARSRSGRHAAWQAVWTSRLVVLLGGVFGALAIGRAPGTSGFDPAGLTSPFGYFGNLLAAPFARWDSAWYLSIAQSGYGHQLARAQFFPLYPLTVRWLGSVLSSDLVAGILISLIAFTVALVLLHRLVTIEIGEEVARVAVLLLAFCPMSYYLSAVYSESLFLALSLGCVLLARSGRWGWAGLLGGLAAAERATGIALVVPFAIMFLYGPRTDRLPDFVGAARRWQRLVPAYRPTFALAWILLIPAGLGAFLLGLALSSGNGLAPLHTHALWFRHFAGPFGGVWAGIVAAWDGLRQLVHGPPPPTYFKPAGGDPLLVAQGNLVQFGFLALGAVALVGAFRRLPIAYGAYALASLAMPLSYPVTPQPLQSISRYELVLFPLFMWGAWWIWRRRLVTPAIAALGVMLGLFTAEFATWRFVA